MKILETRELAVPAVKVVRYARFPDDRGYFTETFRMDEISAAIGGEEIHVVQANESRSKAGVARGLHFQWNPYQGKLVRPIEGRLIDLALDIRKGSPNFGQIVGRDMRPTPERDEGEWIWLPPGFAHGAVFTEDAAIEYLCTSGWSPGCEASISPLAEDIDWSLCEPELADEVRSLLDGDAILSGKDRDGPSLAAWLEDPRSDEFIFAWDAPWDVTSGIASVEGEGEGDEDEDDDEGED
jgi:dTDP-4-dehydrorhamnose 3,5-epimerase